MASEHASYLDLSDLLQRGMTIEWTNFEGFKFCFGDWRYATMENSIDSALRRFEGAMITKQVDVLIEALEKKDDK